MFNEDSRVKIPAILHLVRLGYEYLSKRDHAIDSSTNIFTDVFLEQIKRINSFESDSEAEAVMLRVQVALDNEDLGRSFYDLLLGGSGIKLVDFDNFDSNSFHVVTELTYKNGEEEFRPDITILVNGMPLAFIEVKKPNNHEGIKAERDRINVRFRNSKFRKFMNITQLLVFSNNMEYGEHGINPLQGAFYATTSTSEAKFNNFREEIDFGLLSVLGQESTEAEDFVLRDCNKQVIKNSPEFVTNKSPSTPTNRILTSLFCRERISVLLQYGLAYVDDPDHGVQKQVMRYPQLFATLAIRASLERGNEKGIIWHTQGSGKTALAYFNVRYLSDYFRRKGQVAKFYFIVDRLDLMDQASSEFSLRGLVVRNVDSRESFSEEFQQSKAVHNFAGRPEITVVNIQKFSEETANVRDVDYDISTQRVYFLDEAHRSYKSDGSFLANLYNADRKAIKIALTGTPLIVRSSGDLNAAESPATTRAIFGDYIHKYYYDASIADGYTLRLIREDIQSNVKVALAEVLKRIETKRGTIGKSMLRAHDQFCAPLAAYINADFRQSRIRFGNETIGAMVVCDSADQARNLHRHFLLSDTELHSERPLGTALILHDEGTKQDRRDQIDLFKAGKIDVLFVYNMLLTGFDAKRLKKLYLARVVKAHNLLQTLTRVNRPYAEFTFGYVVDFADISHEFDLTNRAYFEELNQLYGAELEAIGDLNIFDQLFRSEAEIQSDLEGVYETLFRFNLKNAEIFSQQINEIFDRDEIIDIKKSLDTARSLYNVAVLSGHADLIDRIDFRKLTQMFNEVSRRLDLINLTSMMQQGSSDQSLLNAALENVVFNFTKVSEAELILADRLRVAARRAREGLASNFDPADPVYISLYEELQRLFRRHNISEMDQAAMHENIRRFDDLFKQISTLNRRNDNLRQKYDGDVKYVRIHKRIHDEAALSLRETELYQLLTYAKSGIDDAIANNRDVLRNEGYVGRLIFEKTIGGFDKFKMPLADSTVPTFISDHLAKEYVDEFRGSAA